MQYPIINIFLTRRCNKRCDGCEIVKQKANDLPPEKWVEFAEMTPNSFFGFLGGEPLAYPHIEKLTELFQPYSYCYISNSLMLTENKANKLVKAGLKNWSASIDYPGERSEAGYKALTKFKDKGVKDLHATITFYPDLDFNYLEKMLDKCRQNDFFIEFTFCDVKKNDYYTSFSTVPDWDVKSKNKVKKIIEGFSDYDRLHLPAHFLLSEFDRFIKGDFKCNTLVAPMVDCDGRLLLCRDIDGGMNYYFPSLYTKKFLTEWNDRKDKMCEGCNWSCTAPLLSNAKIEWKHNQLEEVII
jgi:MoaA/NifB/PqqE/SkfB family radical SAM enzyme